MTTVHSQGGSTLAELVTHSRKLGADRTVCNWDGGNTSVKADERDIRGAGRAYSG